MRFLVVILLSIFIGSASAQNTAIPDPNFEQALINLGLDVVIDGQVLTANIDTVTDLFLILGGISDMTGIEDFSDLKDIKVLATSITSLNLSQNLALETIDCNNNSLTSLTLPATSGLTTLSCIDNQILSIDVSQNTGLIDFRCSTNLLTSLDVSQNNLLTVLYCDDNQITNLNVAGASSLITLKCIFNLISSLDVTQNNLLSILLCDVNSLTALDLSQNPNLSTLACGTNQLTTLDVSQNPALTFIACSTNLLSELDVSQNSLLDNLGCKGNQLTCLNLKNGNNTNFVGIGAYNNPNLTCIEVDDVSFSNNSWTGFNFVFDTASSFSTNCNNACSPVGIDELTSATINIHPNPTTGQLSISLEEAKTGVLRVLNSLGQVVFEDTFEAVKELDISLDVPSGLYFLQVESDGQVITKKVVKE
jgi:Leucine-rich repeat (LRR) protein